jgi:hypothetical protein
MRTARAFIRIGGGKLAAGMLMCAGVLALGLMWRAHFPSSAAGRASAGRMFICSETGKAFRHTLREGQSIPVRSPHSGRQTGYEADTCYWTREGSISDEPRYVYVAGRWGGSGPTFCPDCGRLVRPLNPAPRPGAAPPPMEAEYRAGDGRSVEDAR